jgi:flagellar biosynthesis/type III secretory pathway protein FliH
VAKRKNKMSKENIQKFHEMLMQTPDAVEALNKATIGAKSVEDAAGILIEFAKDKGFDFSIEDLVAYEQDKQQELSPEELEKINAAGGGYCLGIGLGWSEGYGIGYTQCTAVGKGLGVTWSKTNDLENEEGNRLVKNIVEIVAHATSKIIGK